MRADGARGDGVAFALEVAAPVVVGLSVLATLRVSNAGDVPVIVSSRLNLAEGDVQLTVVGPDGATRVIRGWQADTAARRVTLQPGEYIAAGINLLHTDAGPTFPVPGSYTVRGEYQPSPQAALVTSSPVSVTVRLPRPGPEGDAAAILANETLRLALIRARPDDAHDGLTKLAAGPGGLLDNDLARMLTSPSAADGGAADPVRRGLAITTLCSPYSKVGKLLAADFATRLAQQAADQEGTPAGRPDAVETALRIVKGEPIES